MSLKSTSKIWLTAVLLFVMLTGWRQGFANPEGQRGTFPLIENFESGVFPPSGWTAYDVDGSAPAWEMVDWLSHTPGGFYSAYHGYGPGMQDAWLVSPQLAVPAAGTTVVAFWNFVVDPSYYAKNSVWVSTGSGDPASGQFVEIWTPATPLSEWRQVVLSLAAYAGQNIYVAFRYEGDFAHGWAIDDIEVSDSFNTSPVVAVNPTAINATGPINAGIQKSLTVANAGVENLEYEITVYYSGSTSGWLNVSPLGGTIAGGNNLVHTAAFDPSGLELGTYNASIVINSNDPETPTTTIPVAYSIIGPATVSIDVMLQDYTFPYDISENGNFVAVSAFGVGGWLWSANSGLQSVPGEEPLIQSVSENGIIAGTERNPAYSVSGMNVAMAGTWNYQTGEWTFLGINPEVGEPVFTDYTSCWGMTADGQTIVGMQFYPDYSYRAFKWTQAGGYEMIGNMLTTGNRPNGISNDGSVVFGWADLPLASRSPIIWYNNEVIQIAPSEFGEANASSSNGEYVTGYAGTGGFLWSKQDGTTVFFENSLNPGGISPVAVMDDGTVFGYTSEGWPPFPDTRRAFVRLTSGEMMTFNDYAITRGMFDAADWLFYSINGVTPDGNKFIGAGINPDGQTVSFLLDFGAEIPSIVVSPLTMVQALEYGQTAMQDLSIQNTGNGALNYNAFIHFQSASALQNNALQTVLPYTNTTKGAAGFVSKSKSAQPIHPAKRRSLSAHTPLPVLANSLTSFEKPLAPSTVKTNEKSTSRGTYTLHYDGDNADAIGLVAGGSFFHASRYPQEVVAPFIGAGLTQVEMYLNDATTASTLYIWSQGTTGTPGDVIYEQPVSLTPYSWNTITLPTSIALTGADIWIGFGHTHDAGAFVAGLDGGPLNPNGDFIREASSEWERLSDYGFASNWNIRAVLTLGDGSWLTVSPTSGIVEGGASQNLTVSFDGNIPAGEGYHANIIIESNDATHPIVYVPVTLDVLVGLNEQNDANWHIYPVPAESAIFIQSANGMRSISLYNSRGQLVSEQSSNDQHAVSMEISSLPAGLYMVKMTDQSGKSFQKTILKK